MNKKLLIFLILAGVLSIWGSMYYFSGNDCSIPSIIERIIDLDQNLTEQMKYDMAKMIKINGMCD